jgi:hypothetical protein
VDVDRPADGAGIDRISVVVEAHEAGLRDRRLHLMEAVEAATIRHKLLPFFFEDIPDRFVGDLGVAMGLCVEDALVKEPGVHLVIALKSQARREEALARQSDLVLDLPFFPASGRCASHRLDEIVAAHLRKPAIVEAILADEDRLNGRFHVVVNAALAGAFEKGKGTVMRVEDPLLGLARIGAHKWHAAVAEADVSDLNGDRRAIEHDDFMAPVELVGLAGRKREGHIGLCQRRAALLAPAYRVTTNRIVASVITKTALS